MDKNVHPVAAALVMGLCLLAIGGWLWCSHEAKRYGGPAAIAVNPDGHLYLQIQNQLLEHDANGQFVARHDLAALGVETMLGEFGFFSNGDVLLRRGEDTRSVLDTIRAYMRQTNRRSTAATAADVGLARCQLGTARCATFGPEPIDFAAAFGLHIDPETDDVYISDSSRHIVRKYSADGRQQAESAAGFRFPNQLALHDGQLLVADTNHHRIRFVQPAATGFGTETRVAAVVPPEASANEQRWTRGFLRVGDRWWVNNMQAGMNFGGIYEFDNDWQYVRQIPLPVAADPIAMIAFDDSVLITDWYGDRVHRLTIDGEAMSDFSSEGLQEVIEHSRERRSFLMLCAWSIVALALGLIIIVLARGTQWAGPAAPAATTKTTSANGGRRLIEPDSDHVHKLHRSMRLALWLLVPLPIATLVLLYFAKDPARIAELILIAVGAGLFITLFYWMVKVNASTSIAFDDDRVTLKNHRNEEFRIPISKLRYTAHAVATDEVAVFLGQAQMPLYDREVVLQELETRLHPDQRISAWAMQLAMIRMRHPNGVVAVFAWAVIVIGLLLLLIT